MAGLAAAGASVLLALVVGLAILQLAMASSAKRVVMSYSTAVIGKVALATLACEYLSFPFLCVYCVMVQWERSIGAGGPRQRGHCSRWVFEKVRVVYGGRVIGLVEC